jgi:hypothetical protein
MEETGRVAWDRCATKDEGDEKVKRRVRLCKHHISQTHALSMDLYHSPVIDANSGYTTDVAGTSAD